jgi:uncharacterized protein YjiS (DUF1127 family)
MDHIRNIRWNDQLERTIQTLSRTIASPEHRLSRGGGARATEKETVMVTTEFSPCARPAPAGPSLTAFARGAAERLAGLWRAARNRRSVGKLLAWDDRMLRDIGLTAYDVRAAMAAPVNEDPSVHLGTLSRERRESIRAEARHRLTSGSVQYLRQPAPRRLTSRSLPFPEL